MKRFLKHALLGVLLASTASAATWTFDAPPSDRISYPIDADWRAYRLLEVSVTLEATAPPVDDPPLCAVFLQTKQDWWFQSRISQPLLPGRTCHFVLRLDELSPGWDPGNSLRPWGTDALRWVRNWGVQVFSRQPYSGRVRISAIELTPVKHPAAPTLESPADLPDQIQAGQTLPIDFPVAEFTLNPYDTRDVRLHLECVGPDGADRVPLFYLQKYVERPAPWSAQPDLIALERPIMRANWKPTRPGTHTLRLHGHIRDATIRRELGSITVAPAAAPTAPPAANRERDIDLTEFLLSPATKTMYRYDGGAWEYAPGGKDMVHLRVPLDWTTEWGHYTGLGEFDQLLAYRFDRVLEEYARLDKTCRLVIFAEDELLKTGIFNWVDHPMNRANGGMLQRPPPRCSAASGHNRWCSTEPATSGPVTDITRPSEASRSC